MKRMTTFVAAMLLISANLFTGSAALAHDEVVSVYPEAGSSVEAGMVDLSITFNEEVMATENATGFEVVVTDAKGVKQQVGCINPIGSTLGARAALGTEGEYTVSWHSVSSDGHPSEGDFKFTVTGSAELDADLINNCPRLLIAPMPVDDPSAIAYASSTDDTSAVANDSTPLEIGLLILAVIIVLGAAVWVTTKSKRAKD